MEYFNANKSNKGTIEDVNFVKTMRAKTIKCKGNIFWIASLTTEGNKIGIMQIDLSTGKIVDNFRIRPSVLFNIPITIDNFS